MRVPHFLHCICYFICILILQSTCQVLTAQDKTNILLYHNNARAAVDPPASNMQTMVWNTTLESWAQTWASGCQNTDSNTNILDHSPSSSRPGAGENIFASTGTASVQGAVDSWNAEKQYYVYSTNYCNGQLYTANSPVWGYCGHYTQIAWASSSQLGCARANCANIPYPSTIVCNYSPPGNYYGGSNNEFYRPYATAAPGSSPSSSPGADVGGGDKNGGKSSNRAAVAGGVIAGLVVLLAGAGVAFFLYRRKKNAYSPSYYNNNASGNSSINSTPSTPSPSSSNPPNKPVVVMSTTDIQKSFMSQAPENSQTGYKPPVSTNPKPPVPSHAVPKPPVPSNNNNNAFPVGSNCKAKYSGDGQFYNAIVKQFDPSKGYLVSYPEYAGEQEWLPASSLKK